MSDSEDITTGIMSALYFGGHMDNARGFMKETSLVQNMHDKSHFCRRIHSFKSIDNESFHPDWQIYEGYCWSR